MTFAMPQFFLVAIALTVVYAIFCAVDHTRRRRDREKIGAMATVAKMVAGESRRRRVGLYVLWTLGMTLAGMAFLRPLIPGKGTWTQRGIDVALVVDYSSSMLVADVYPNRLALAKRYADGLRAELQADRVATVLFAGEAIRLPLTHDHDGAATMLDEVAPRDLPAGTNLGHALHLARCTLRPNFGNDCPEAKGGAAVIQGRPELAPIEVLENPDQDRAAAIVVLTDGGDGSNDLEVDDMMAAGIEVFFVAVGTRQGERIPELDEKGDRIGWVRENGEFVRSRLNEEAIKKWAEVAGGSDRYFELDRTGSSLDNLLFQLRALKKGLLDERVVNTMTEIYAVFLLPAFLLLLVEGCATARRRKRS